MPIIGAKVCSKCKTTRSLDFFYLNKKSGIRESWCRLCKNGKFYSDIKSDHRKRLYMSSKLNSYRKNVEHTIKVDDIPSPEVCIYLGIKLDYDKVSEGKNKRLFNAPSIDRIDPTKGYTPDNIQVISELANRMKQNATPEQLLEFAFGILRVHGIK